MRVISQLSTVTGLALALSLAAPGHSGATLVLERTVATGGPALESHGHRLPATSEGRVGPQVVYLQPMAYMVGIGPSSLLSSPWFSLIRRSSFRHEFFFPPRFFDQMRARSVHRSFH